MTGRVDLAKDIERTLQPLGTRQRAIQEKRYLKSDLDHLGITVPVVRATLRKFRASDRDELRTTVDALWARGIYELRFAACLLLVRDVALLTARDLPWLLRLVRGAKTWALVDTLAPFVVGKLATDELDDWITDDDFWVRRAALLALLVPLRQGAGDWPRFTRYADAQLEDKEFFIRKAIGWILREASRKTPDRVYEWLLPRAHRAAGLTVREATKYLSATQRDAISARARGAGSRRDPSRPARRDAAAGASRSRDTQPPRRRPGGRGQPGTRRA
jgi:3-methyladenine DNA glycosylase AlkD